MSFYDDFLLQVTVVWVTWHLFLLSYNLYILLTTSSFWNYSSAILLKIKVITSAWILVCSLTFWLCTEYAVLEVKTSIFSLWQCNELSKTLLPYDAAVVSQNRKNLRLISTACIEVSVPFQLWRDMQSPLLHRVDDVLLQGEEEGTEDPHHRHTIEMRVCVLQLRRQTGQSVTCRGASAQAETVQELHCSLRDNTFLFKLTESSTVHLLRLCEREMVCPRVDSTALILSCWEGWCAQLTLLWKVEVILGSLHFANSGE